MNVSDKRLFWLLKLSACSALVNVCPKCMGRLVDVSNVRRWARRVSTSGNTSWQSIEWSHLLVQQSDPSQHQTHKSDCYNETSVGLNARLRQFCPTRSSHVFPHPWQHLAVLKCAHHRGHPQILDGQCCRIQSTVLTSQRNINIYAVLWRKICKDMPMMKHCRPPSTSGCRWGTATCIEREYVYLMFMDPCNIT